MLVYAADGVILLNAQADLEQPIGIIEAWTLKNGSLLNLAKYGIVIASDLRPVRVYGQQIPVPGLPSYQGWSGFRDIPRITNPGSTSQGSLSWGSEQLRS